MNLAINLIGTSNESGSKTYCVNFYKNLKYSSHIKNYKKVIVFISQDYLKKKEINQYKKKILKLFLLIQFFQTVYLKSFMIN